MNDYQQPDFYRFNLDSVTLVRRVQRQIKAANSILDLGAGSGFIGIELSRSFKPQVLTLLEGQDAYLECLRNNVDFYLTPETETEIIINTFGQWKPQRVYDLIVSNPPYFLPGRGEASSNTNRGMARTFMVDSWKILLNRIEESLSPTGKAFFVVRHDKKIMEAILENWPEALGLNTQVIDNIVFLDLFRLHKD